MPEVKKKIDDELSVEEKKAKAQPADKTPKVPITNVSTPFLVCPTEGCDYSKANKENVAPGNEACPKCSAKLVGAQQDSGTVKLMSLLETTTVDNVEIFRAGVWNGDKYTVKDLQQVVSNFVNLTEHVKPPIKLGHGEDQSILKREGLPAGGWIKKLRLIGDKIVATITDVPKQLARLIKNKQYKRVSAEIYPEYEIAGKKYKNVLRAVALLGEDIPAIDSLKDVELLYTAKNNKTKYVTFESKIIKRKVPLKQEVSVMGMKINTKKLSEAVLKKFAGEDLIGGAVPTDGDGAIDATKEEVVSAVSAAIEEVIPTAIETAIAGQPDIMEEDGVIPPVAPDAGADGAKDKTIADLKARVAELEAQLNSAQGEATQASEELDKFQEASKAKDIKAFAESLVTQGKLLPIKKPELVEMLTNADSTKAVKKFTETIEGKKVDKTLTQYDMIKKFASSQPEWVQFAEVSRDGEVLGIKTEVTGADGTKYPTKDAELDLKVKQYAQENKVSYEEALIEVSQ